MDLETRERSRKRVFWVQVLILCLLLLFALAYWRGGTFVLPGKNRLNLYCLLPNPVGAIPLEIPWFGALGGTLLSLQAVLSHRTDWDPQMVLWHWARPLVGAAFGVVAFFLLVVTIQASGSSVSFPGPEPSPSPTAEPVDEPVAPPGTETTPAEEGAATQVQPSPRPQTSPSPQASPVLPALPTPVPVSTTRCISSSGPRPVDIPTPDLNSYIYYAFAFIVGYRESTFRRLLRRVVDIIFVPGGETAATPRRQLRIAVSQDSEESQLGVSHRVTATVADLEGNPRKGEVITFLVTGANETSDLKRTDASGLAEFEYQGENEGSDSIVAFVDLNGDDIPQATEPQATLTKKWGPAPTRAT